MFAARGTWFFALAGFAPGCSDPDRHSSASPNVVVVVADTLRADRMPFHGHDAEVAPFLSELAARSVVFERAWSTSSWTAPATASLFTSVYPNQHGVVMGVNAFQRNQVRGDTTSVRVDRLPQDLETVAELMRSQGYRTFAVTDNPNVCRELGFDQGFDRLASFDYRGAPAVNAALARWVEEIRAAERSFVYLHYMDPHKPYYERAPWHRPPPIDDGDDRHVAASAAYDSEIRYLDEHLREAFEMLGVGDDTVVLFTADHGEEFGDHGGSAHGFQLYSELTHVPLFLRVPGLDPARVDRDVGLTDVLPTLRELVGAPASDQDEGVSLLRYARGGSPAERPLFAHRRRGGGDAARDKWSVVRGGYKLVLTEPGGTRELFELRSDPEERADLSTERSELADELERVWLDFDRRARRWTPGTAELSLDPDEVERLEALGYAGATDDGG